MIGRAVFTGFAILAADPTAAQELPVATSTDAVSVQNSATPETQTSAGVSDPIFTYKLKGARELWPEFMHDNGSQIFIKWGRDQAIPAVFAISDSGNEEMIDGYMRDDVYVIDRICRKLSFRIDKSQATATRMEQEGTQR